MQDETYNSTLNCNMRYMFLQVGDHINKVLLLSSVTEMRKCKSSSGEFEPSETSDALLSYWQLGTLTDPGSRCLKSHHNGTLKL